MKIDFTFGGKISPQYARLFNQIAVDIQHPFTELINSVSRKHAKSIDWWVSSPASRNTLVSPLFHYCCCIALLQELIREKKLISEIVVDSKAFKKIIKDYLARQGINATVTLARLSVKQRLKELVRPIYTIFGLPLKHLLLFFAAQLTRSLRKPLPSDPLTLIDTFIMPGYIEKDRYYLGMLDALSEEEKQRVWFVPHLYGFRLWQYLSVLKRLRKDERNFISKDDFLKFGDYWCLWQHLFRVRKLQIKPSFFCEVDISLLMREELTSFRGISSSYIPLLNYRFAKRLKESGVKLKRVIDWFENQNIDRGWNAGFRRFFPDVEVIGYQGFIVSAHYLCMYPTEVEKDSGVIPHKVAVIGKGLAQSARRFCSDLDVCIAPAFRFQHVWNESAAKPYSSYFMVLVALTIMPGESFHILQLVKDCLKEINIKNTRFWIKPHPTMSKETLKKGIGSKWPEEFILVAGPSRDYIPRSDIMISGMSSICLETMAMGIPVIVVENLSGFNYNPIPVEIPQNLWRSCRESADIQMAIDYYYNRSYDEISQHKQIGLKIREEYFEPVTRDGVREFLGLE